MDRIKALSMMCVLTMSFAMPMNAIGEMDSLLTLVQAEATEDSSEDIIDAQMMPKLPDGVQPSNMRDGEQPSEMPEDMQPPEGSEDMQPPGGTNGTPPMGQPGGGFGGSGTVTQGETANLIDADAQIDGETYISTGDDENALRVDGATVGLTNITVEKTGGASSNTEDGDFYGQNAALLATNSAQITVEDSQISSTVQNGNGIFSYGEGTVVTVSDTTIETEADNSGGIQTTGGGTMNASNLAIVTQGNSSAAIRSDRGGGTVTVDGGSYTTYGTGSPAVYSTADITVSNAVLSAANSEAVVVEGQNSVALENCAVSGSMSGTYMDGSESIHNIMIYQSMSGDADVGTANFSANGGSITALAGDMFYITNTDCTVNLSDTTMQLADGNLMTVGGNSAMRGWGTAGANGAQAEVVFDNQLADGAITVDTISTLALTLSGATQFTGSINIVDNAEGGEAVADNAVITITENAVWNLTADSTISSLENAGTINLNGYTLNVLSTN